MATGDRFRVQDGAAGSNCRSLHLSRRHDAFHLDEVSGVGALPVLGRKRHFSRYAAKLVEKCGQDPKAILAVPERSKCIVLLICNKRLKLAGYQHTKEV